MVAGGVCRWFCWRASGRAGGWRALPPRAAMREAAGRGLGCLALRARRRLRLRRGAGLGTAGGGQPGAGGGGVVGRAFLNIRRLVFLVVRRGERGAGYPSRGGARGGPVPVAEGRRWPLEARQPNGE